MKSNRDNIIRFRRRLFYSLPKNKTLYWICRRYVYYYDGEGDPDMITNGELYVLRNSLQGKLNPIVFDVGANIGDWTAAVLEIAPGARINCFEPGSYAYEKLTNRGFPDGVICNNFGLSSHPSTKKLATYGWASYFNSLYSDRRFDINPEGVEEVRLETLSNYCEKNAIRNIDYVKIDVEGHELEVLKGASKLLSEGSIHVLQFEYGDSYISARLFLKDIFDFFSVYPYEFYKIIPNGLLPVTKYDPELEKFIYSNYLIKLRMSL